MARSKPLLAAAGLAALLAADPAAAFCRTSSCPDVGTRSVCTPAAVEDCGTPLFWASPCITFSMQQDGSSQIGVPEATQIFQTAFATWMAADCGGGATPHILLSDAGPVGCHVQEYNQDRGNANIIMFRDDDWPYAGVSTTLALTTVTYNLDTGEIYDADMELNSFGSDFTVGDTGIVFDLLSIAVHETGHFLGLAHSPNSDATMFASYKEGDIELRSLSADDVAAICTVYPPAGPVDASCDDTPRHGFSSECGSEQPAPPDSGGGCCAVAGSAPRGVPGPLACALLALLAPVLGRRRRLRGTRRP
jgi:hypothetical protein